MDYPLFLNRHYPLVLNLHCHLVVWYEMQWSVLTVTVVMNVGLEEAKTKSAAESSKEKRKSFIIIIVVIYSDNSHCHQDENRKYTSINNGQDWLHSRFYQQLRVLNQISRLVFFFLRQLTNWFNQIFEWKKYHLKRKKNFILTLLIK